MNRSSTYIFKPLLGGRQSAGCWRYSLNNSEQSLLSQNFQSSAEDIKKNYIQKYGIAKCGKCHKREKNRLLRIHKGFDVDQSIKEASFGKNEETEAEGGWVHLPSYSSFQDIFIRLSELS